jgi:CheY-like chemotaxis protein
MKQKKILIVDDEPAFTRGVRRSLEKTGKYEVREENLSVRAADVAMEFQPDLVILDMMMPDMDGSQVANLFKRDPMLKKMPIIFMTAIIPKEELEEEGQHRYVLYLRKPATLVQVIEGIEQALEMNAAQQ